MSSLVTGPWGVALLLLFALGLPLQIAVGGLVGLGRRPPVVAALAVPLLLLLAGLGGTIAGLEDAMAALWHASDPAWAPWFALDDRARAAVPMGLAGAGAATLALPVALGAAWTTFRAPEPLPRRRVASMFFGGVPVALALGVAGVAAALLLDGARPLLLPAIGIPPFLLTALVCASPADPRRFPTVAIGYGALVIAAGGLALGAIGWSSSVTAVALGDYSAPFAAMGAVVVATREAWEVARIAGLLAGGFVLAGTVPVLVRDWSRVDPASGLDALVCGCLALLALFTAGWAGVRERVLSTLAGAHAADVVKSAAGYDVPARAPIPARVLVGEAATPRWIMMRERGGVERLPIAGGLEIVGPAVLRNDGLMLPPKLPLEDLYLSLFESEAGAISVVGCAATPPALLADLARDPLLAVGRCAAFPLTLRVTTKLEDPRVLIVLKDRLVDDGGDVIGITDIPDVAGRDVIVRGQLDATVADLVALLHVLAPAERVYLGHGVTLEGDDLPIGVDPGLRIAKLPGGATPEAPTGVDAPG